MQQPSIATADNNNVMNTKILKEQENLKPPTSHTHIHNASQTFTMFHKPSQTLDLNPQTLDKR
jgi:hypothetical protein